MENKDWMTLPQYRGLQCTCMQDENVARRDPGKVLFEYLVSCFGTSQLERATRFLNVPTRAHDSFPSVQYYNLGKLTVQLILNIHYCYLLCIPTYYYDASHFVMAS